MYFPEPAVNSGVTQILDDLARQFCVTEKPNLFNDTLLVGVQHILETTVDMFSVLRNFGLINAVVGGKHYSTHEGSARRLEAMGFDYVPDAGQLGYGQFDVCMQQVVHSIWKLALEKMQQKHYRLLIILDDGADLLRATPSSLFNKMGIKNRPEFIVGIEQTKNGTSNPYYASLPFPTINVAGSFVKKHIEYPQVASLIAKSVKRTIDQECSGRGVKAPVVGILGCGTMGQALSHHLIAQDRRVIAFDPDPLKQQSSEAIQYYSESSVLISNADIIVGCTGKDVTAPDLSLSALLWSQTKKWLINTGSKDIEFKTLLQFIQGGRSGFDLPDPLKTIRYKNQTGSELEILRGGFPINFTNGAHSVDPAHIWPTRAALLLACISALDLCSFPSEQICTNDFMLPLHAQVLILQKYLALNRDSGKVPTSCETWSEDGKLVNDLIVQRSDGRCAQVFDCSQTFAGTV